MSQLICIPINDELLQAIKVNAQFLHLSQDDYICKAIEQMNNATKKRQQRKLKKASLRTRKKSMKINAEFSEIERDPKQ